MKTVLIAQFKHETNRFSNCITDMGCFKARTYLFGEEVREHFKSVKNELGGFFDALGDCEDIRMVPALALDAMPSGPVSADVFDIVLNGLLERIAQTEQLDGILLSLHGAMVLTSREDGEGDLLEAIRASVGKKLPVIATLDLHANVTKKMVRNATALIAFREYPHTDMYETGLRAAKLMRDTLCENVTPVMQCEKLPLLMPYMPTASAIMQEIQKEIDEHMRRGPVLDISVCHGFFSSDIEEMGALTIAITDADTEGAKYIARELGKSLWERRHRLAREYCDISRAMQAAKAGGEGPLVLADVADNPGAGAPGDSTHMLHALLAHDVKNAAIATIYDPQTVQQAIEAGEGSIIRVCVGGKLCPALCGVPVEADAFVERIFEGRYINQDEMGRGLLVDMGDTAVLCIKDVLIIVASNRIQPWDREVFRSCGIIPEEKQVLVVKSTLHYKQSFGKIARGMMDIETPGVAPQSPMSPQYKNCPRPIFPLDEI